jgi:hypothetical protein
MVAMTTVCASIPSGNPFSDNVDQGATDRTDRVGLRLLGPWLGVLMIAYGISRGSPSYGVAPT